MYLEIYSPESGRSFVVGTDPEARGSFVSFDPISGCVYYRGLVLKNNFYLFRGHFQLQNAYLMERHIVSYDNKEYFVKFDDGCFKLFPFNRYDENDIIVIDSIIADELIPLNKIPPEQYDLFFEKFCPLDPTRVRH